MIVFSFQMESITLLRLFYSSAVALILPQLKDITFVYMVVYEEAQIYDLTVCLYVSQTLTPDTRAQQLFILLF